MTTAAASLLLPFRYHPACSHTRLTNRCSSSILSSFLLREAQIPRGYLGWGNVSTLGFSLAAAIGAKLLSRTAVRERHWRCRGVLHDGQL